MSAEFSVGIALGGGAARGLAHVGAIRALVRAGIPISVVGGTSIGALIGGLFAANGRIEDAESQLRSFLRSPAFAHMRLSFLREELRPPSPSLFYSASTLLKKGILLGYSVAKPSFVPAEEFARHIGALLPEMAIETTALKLVVVAADLATGREVDIDRGPLRLAVAGSCAIPGLLPPIALGEHLLIDGGWVNKVPVRPVRSLGSDFVIAIDVAQDLEDTRQFRNGLNILTRANAICSNRLREMQVAEADFVLKPEVQAIHWADFSRLDAAIEIGERAVESRLPELVSRLNRKRLLTRFRFWRSQPSRAGSEA